MLTGSGWCRFHYMLQYLGVPFQDIEILPPAKGAKL